MEKSSHNHFIETVGLRIKEGRLKAQMTQEQVAEISGIEYKYYQRIEYGKVNITLKTLYTIAEILKIQPSDLLKITE